VDELLLDGINGRRLVLSGLQRDQSHCYYRAELTWAEGSVTTEVIDRSTGLAKFLSDLADAWQGFDGVREFATMEGDLTVACRYDGKGAVECVVSLVRPSWNPPSWTVSVDIDIGAGAHLERIARDSEEFFAIS
jgi:hypothetical protein